MRLFVAFLITFCLSGCSIGYITTSAWKQAKILMNREPIERAVEAPELSAPSKDLLREVPAVRKFAKEELALNVGGAYSTFASVPEENLSWIVMAARKDKFELRTWWFPIVGTVPYKGFGSQAAANDAAAEFEAEGYETWIRPTSAFSTLGWFDDPVLSTMLANGQLALTNTLIHELTHRTVWIKGDVAFNETLANVTGSYGAILYFGSAKSSNKDALFQEACNNFAKQQALSIALEDLFNQLSILYASNSSTILAERNTIFDAWRAKNLDIAAGWPILNNARLMQARLYYTRFVDMARIVQALSIPTTLSTLKKVGSPWQWLDQSLTTLNSSEGNHNDNICG